MAHEFESGFFTAVPAWHKLGTVLTDAPSIEKAIEMSGTDWKVLEKPLYADIGQEFGKGDKLRENDVVMAKNVYTYKALVRDTDNRVLGVVGKDYHPVQNKDAFQWFDFLLDNHEATLEAGGSLREGQRIWVLAKMNQDPADVMKGDTIESYLLLSNAHDGSMGVWLMFTPIRVVCMNTLSAALSTKERAAKSGKAISFRHTPNVEEQMEWAKNLVSTSKRIFDNSMESYRAFTKVRMDDAQFAEYFDRVYYGTDKVNVEREMEAVEAAPAKGRTRRLLGELFEAGTGTNIPGVRGTLWAGYNAVTEWVDHYRSVDTNRLSQSWYGGGNSLRTRAFNEALKLAKVG